ncbi:MAG TPA: alpha/beta hydrolase [Trebonia sp.]|nr:alpha/beta hydrolase [Trebonia sp.]
MATVRLDAGEFYYAEYGDPAGMPLVLLHGMPRDHSSWAGIAPELVADGLRVIAPDLRGHGTSARTSAYSFELMREDLHQLAGALRLDRFVLGGHSAGGTVATLFAERYPDRLAGLILVDSPPPDGSGSYDPGPRPEGDLPYDWAVMPAILGQLSHPDPAWWADLPAITAPALLIGGGSTSPVPQDLLAKASRLMPDGSLVTIEGAGHSVHQSRPAEFLAAVRPFLRRVREVSGQALNS